MPHSLFLERVQRAAVTLCVIFAVAGCWSFGVAALFYFLLGVHDREVIQLAMLLSTIPLSIFLAPKVWKVTAKDQDSVPRS